MIGRRMANIIKRFARHRDDMLLANFQRVRGLLVPDRIQHRIVEDESFSMAVRIDAKEESMLGDAVRPAPCA